MKTIKFISIFGELTFYLNWFEYIIVKRIFKLKKYKYFNGRGIITGDNNITYYFDEVGSSKV